MDTNRRQRSVVTIRVPTTERGEAGFIKNLHDAFVADKRVVFNGDHTTVARILWGFDSKLCRQISHRPDTQQMRHTPRRSRTITIKVPTQKRGVERFNEKVKDAISVGKQVKFDSLVKSHD